MIDTQVQKQPQPKTVVGPNSSTGRVATMQATVPSEAKIRERAYELYENRSREPGQDEQDWFSAEQEIINRTK
jgi:hypothetical protein